MFTRHSAALGGVVRRLRLVPEERLRELEAEAVASGRPLAELLLRPGGLDKADLLAGIARALGVDWLDVPPHRLAPGVVALVPPALARAHGVVPLRGDAREVTVLCLDPLAAGDLHELSFALGREVRACVADPEDVAGLLREHYGAGADLLAGFGEGAGEEGAAGVASAEELAAMAGQPPVVRFVNEVLEEAIRERASDIHFEPFERELRIRCRIDGVLREWPSPPPALVLPVASRLKVIANLDIAERRVPQDGRIKLTLAGRPVDLRVSTLPTQFGESVVLRVLDRENAGLSLDRVGLPAAELAGLRAAIRRPSGIIVVTGPTGSGKTTTLYSCLREINESGAKLLTVEDPIEYEIEGLLQVAVNPAAGLTFATALRSFLRQDPDVVMVGEIRDLETAQVAIQAALTGHLVLTTLHTNDAAGAVARLVDLGVEPFLVAAALEVVVAQRLVRRICTDCCCEQVPPAETRERLTPVGGTLAGMSFYVGAGCPSCQGSGYRGRLGLFELLTVTDELRERIARRAGTLELRDCAQRQGMRTLRDAGMAALAARATTPEEVLKYT
ncbi:MAG: type II/IV secretion system protein [Opitutaceae bacterium]|nr:type II/IV secretion system protein [Opitutaceae bacterium]